MSYTKNDFEALSDESLVHAELQLDRDLVELRFRKNAGSLRNVMKVREVRRNIARVRTEQRNRERAAELGKNALRDQHRGTFVPAVVSESVEGSSFASDLNAQMEDTE